MRSISHAGIHSIGSILNFMRRSVLRALLLGLFLIPIAPEYVLAQAGGQILPPLQPWAITNQYLSCDQTNLRSFTTAYPGDSPQQAMQEYVDAENANCQGQDGGYFTVQFTLNACTPTPPVANGYRGIYGGCTYHGHATPTPAYCLINPLGAFQMTRTMVCPRQSRFAGIPMRTPMTVPYLRGLPASVNVQREQSPSMASVWSLRLRF